MVFLFKGEQMAWQETAKPKLTTATPALAKKWRGMERFPRDRDLSPTRLEFIKKAILANEFRGSELACISILETGKEYRINGKHTSEALFQLFDSGVEFTPPVMLVREYAADTMEDAARLYATFDARQSARTKADVIRGFASASPLLESLESRKLTLACAGMAYSLWEDKMRHHDACEQSMLLVQNADFALWMTEMISGVGKNRHIFRMSVVAAMVKTWSKAKAAATEFWTGIRDGCTDPPGSPRQKLYRWLLTHTIGSGAGKNAKEAASERETLVRCLHAWNAWRRNESTNLAYVSKAKTPAAA